MLNVKQIIEATNGKLLNGNEDYIIKDYSLDSRNIKEDDFFIPIVGKKSNAHDYIIGCVEKGICGFFIETTEKNKDEIIIKAINIRNNIIIIEINNSEDSLYEIGKYNRQLHKDIPVIAITGSVGKTSTREIIASILSKKYNVLTTYKNYNGYIGLSLMLLKLEDQDLAILEHGIDFIGEMNKLALASKPKIAVITMIGTAHIGILGSKENIFKEKMDVAKYMDKSSTIILNSEDEYLNNYSNTHLNIEKFSISEAENIINIGVGTEFITNIYNKKEKVFINTLGEHNIYNALASIKVAELFNVETQQILDGIAQYKNLSGRFEKIEFKNNITIIDDTYNASIDSMKSGLTAISKIKSKRKIAVLGDMLELGEYSDNLHLEVGRIFKDIEVDMLYTLGESSKIIAQEAKQYVNNIKTFEKKEKLIVELCQNISNGDLVYFKASNLMRFGDIIAELKKHIEMI